MVCVLHCKVHVKFSPNLTKADKFQKTTFCTFWISSKKSDSADEGWMQPHLPLFGTFPRLSFQLSRQTDSHTEPGEQQQQLQSFPVAKLWKHGAGHQAVWKPLGTEGPGWLWDCHLVIVGSYFIVKAVQEVFCQHDSYSTLQTVQHHHCTSYHLTLQHCGRGSHWSWNPAHVDCLSGLAREAISATCK